MYSVVSFKLRPKRGEEEKKGQKAGGETVRCRNGVLVRERERILSRFLGNPTIRIRRDKKESCSTHRGLRVGTGFKEF